MCNYQNRLVYFIALSKLWIAWSLMGYLFENGCWVSDKEQIGLVVVAEGFIPVRK